MDDSLIGGIFGFISSRFSLIWQCIRKKRELRNNGDVADYRQCLITQWQSILQLTGILIAVIAVIAGVMGLFVYLVDQLTRPGFSWEKAGIYFGLFAFFVFVVLPLFSRRGGRIVNDEANHNNCTESVMLAAPSICGELGLRVPERESDLNPTSSYGYSQMRQYKRYTFEFDIIKKTSKLVDTDYIEDTFQAQFEKLERAKRLPVSKDIKGFRYKDRRVCYLQVLYARREGRLVKLHVAIANNLVCALKEHRPEEPEPSKEDEEI
ncbi:MAG: MFS transporter [Oscillospiraceae bacterium]|jgi:hypothetical protein|nr:MFS transporter [Oscillospiraceae bacterium]